MPLLYGDYALLHKLAYIGCGKIIVPSNEKSELTKNLIFRDLDDHYPKRITTVQAGVPHRLWQVKANSLLTNLLTESIGEDIWIRDLSMIKQVQAQSKTPPGSYFKRKWIEQR